MDEMIQLRKLNSAARKENIELTARNERLVGEPETARKALVESNVALNSIGTAIRRDAWVYNFNRAALADSAERMMDFFNANIPDLQPQLVESGFQTR